GEYGYERVNVAAEHADPTSLLRWMERALRTVRECPEFGVGEPTVLDIPQRPVFGLRYDAPGGSMLALHNLGERAVSVDLGSQPGQDGVPRDVVADRRCPA